MYDDLTREELDGRMVRFRTVMDAVCPDWGTAIIVGKVNQYYFLGTMQDGILMIRREGKCAYFARRSYERAKAESPFEEIYPMESYREAADVMGRECGNTFIEAETATFAMIERMKKHFDMDTVKSLDRVILSVRAVKSPYELYWMEESGRQHDHFLREAVPGLLREGMSEAEFVAELFRSMVYNGYQGISRFSMFQTEIVVGQVGFGESSIYPTSFDGPGGAYGMCPAVPLVGSRERILKKGDLVFVDIGYGVNGYHSDKTQVYVFGGQPTDEMVKSHRECIAIQSRLAEMLKPGALPFEIYHTVIDELPEEFKVNFMGFGERQVKFLGHGVGLHIDEMPVIANGFKTPLQENMVIALEPKKGMAGIGMVGVEDTYVVTPEGGRCITGGGCDIIVV